MSNQRPSVRKSLDPLRDLSDVLLGHFLKRKLALAKVEFIKYQDLFVEFMDGLQPANVAQWLKEAEDWEKDPANPDPYYVTPSGQYGALCTNSVSNYLSLWYPGLTEAQIRAQLTEEEAAQSDDSPSHQVSPLTMMVEMLEIEDQQYVFYPTRGFWLTVLQAPLSSAFSQGRHGAEPPPCGGDH